MTHAWLAQLAVGRAADERKRRAWLGRRCPRLQYSSGMAISCVAVRAVCRRASWCALHAVTDDPTHHLLSDVLVRSYLWFARARLGPGTPRGLLGLRRGRDLAGQCVHSAYVERGGLLLGPVAVSSARREQMCIAVPPATSIRGLTLAPCSSACLAACVTRHLCECLHGLSRPTACEQTTSRVVEGDTVIHIPIAITQQHKI
jgi:hypothetical protein